MASRLYHLTIDSHDPASLARFWATALGQRVLLDTPDEVIVGANEYAYPGLCFVRVPGRKTVKNRLHIDLVSDDMAAEAGRLIALGARPADVGQPRDGGWVVLADPEGNEFCVLRPHLSLVE
jgi:predicted enzyme related to lactoylglutathione lyase